jgi:hypothetical protein
VVVGLGLVGQCEWVNQSEGAYVIRARTGRVRSGSLGERLLV